jgi:polyphosphate kinase
MDRNLDRRIEVVTPVDDAEARARLGTIVDIMLADDRHSWQLGADGRWRRTEDLAGSPGSVGTFELLRDQAMMAGELAATPHRPRSGAGSLDPRA